SESDRSKTEFVQHSAKEPFFLFGLFLLGVGFCRLRTRFCATACAIGLRGFGLRFSRGWVRLLGRSLSCRCGARGWLLFFDNRLYRGGYRSHVTFDAQQLVILEYHRNVTSLNRLTLLLIHVQVIPPVCAERVDNQRRAKHKAH